MDKVFFRNRVVYLSGDPPGADDNGGIQVHRFTGRKKLKKLLESFQQSKDPHSMMIYYSDQDLLRNEFISCFTYIGAGGGLVLNRHNEFLVIERNGVWDLPKGKLEQGEEFKSAALREVEEETGLDRLNVTGFLTATFHTYSLGKEQILKETRWFEMNYRGDKMPDLQGEEGITDYRWVKPGEEGFIRKNTFASILEVLESRNLL